MPLNKPRPRRAVVGVGQELRGDDAAGIIAARTLQSAAGAGWLVVDAGAAPENFTGKLRAFAPDVVLILDAAQMDAPPGTLRLFAMDDLEHCSLTTHGLSCHLFARYLGMELRCAVKLLGIQIGQDTFGRGLSPAVGESVGVMCAVLQGIMGDDKRSE